MAQIAQAAPGHASSDAQPDPTLGGVGAVAAPAPQQHVEQEPQQDLPQPESVVAAIKLVLDGKQLAETSAKSLRRLVAAHLKLGQPISDGVGTDGLENHKEWFNDLAQPVVDLVASVLPVQGAPEWLQHFEDENAKVMITLITFSLAPRKHS